MKTNYVEINRKGKWIKIPAVPIGERTIIVMGKWVRMASIFEEDWIEGEPVEDPEWLIAKIKELNIKADIFKFSRRLPENEIRYSYHAEKDNVAAIPISSFDDWWQKRISRKTRQEVLRAGRLGVVVKIAKFNEDLIQDIAKLFNAITCKQGVPFAAYGMDYGEVKRAISSYIDRSDFIAAYYQHKLIGYSKIVYMGKIGSIMNILTNNAYYNMRPANALIAEAVKTCVQKGMLYLQYGKYIYRKKTKNTLTEFKRRNGFEMIERPRYFVPLNLKGRVSIKMKLHLGILSLLPSSLISILLKFRSLFNRYILIPIKFSKMPHKFS